jgi:hypothetical protein
MVAQGSISWRGRSGRFNPVRAIPDDHRLSRSAALVGGLAVMALLTVGLLLIDVEPC